MIYLFTFVLAFCSIVYELLLGQSLSAFLGNTVLRYCVTIGLYMVSMGIGAMLAEGRRVHDPVVALLRIETLLSLTGGLSVLLLHGASWVLGSGAAFSLLAHGLIVAVGVLTGFEIPLLIEVRHVDAGDSENSVLGVDYLGAFAGAVLFAFVFYPKLGILPTAFFTALLNAAVGLALFTQSGKVRPEGRRAYGTLIGVQAALVVAAVAGLLLSERIHDFLMQRYLAL